MTQASDADLRRLRECAAAVQRGDHEAATVYFLEEDEAGYAMRGYARVVAYGVDDVDPDAYPTRCVLAYSESGRGLEHVTEDVLEYIAERIQRGDTRGARYACYLARCREDRIDPETGEPWPIEPERTRPGGW